MPHYTTRRLILAGAGALLATPFVARAQDRWPSRPIRLIVPFAPGGSNDAIARPLADGLTTLLGRSVVVENRPGAAGTLGANTVARAPADGYTLLIVSSSFATSAAMQRTPYDPVASFQGVASICSAPMLVVTAPGSRHTNMKALIEHARAEPSMVQYGTAGHGNIGHMATELLNLVAGMQTEAVPYAGIGPAQLDLLAGRLDFVITTMASVRTLVDAGRLPVIGFTSRERAPYAPNVPTVREQTGLDYDVDVFWGVVGPSDMPPSVVAQLNQAVNAVISRPFYQRFLDIEGALPVASTAQQFSEKLRLDVERWAMVAQRAGIRPS